jgi:hypothetical protein
MYAGKEATAEFGDYHSAEAVAHMAHFCIGDLVEADPHPEKAAPAAVSKG